MRVVCCEILRKLDNSNKLLLIDDIDIIFYRFRDEYNEKIINIISRCANLKFIKLYTHDPIKNIGELAKLQNLIKYDVKVFRDYTFCLSFDKKNLIYVYSENTYNKFVDFLCTNTVENITLFLPALEYYFKIIKILPTSTTNVKFILKTTSIDNTYKDLLTKEHSDNLPVCLNYIKLIIFYSSSENYRSSCSGLQCNNSCKITYNYAYQDYTCKHKQQHAEIITDENCCFCMLNNSSLLTTKLLNIETDLTIKLCNILKLPFGCDYKIEILDSRSI